MTLRHGWAPLAFLVVSAWAPSADAQIVGQGQPLRGQINQGATITLDVSDRPLEDVLEHIRNKVGISVVTPPGTEGQVTINLREIPWRDALELVAENAGCIVTEQSARLFKVEKPPRVTMSFTAVDIKQVIEAIAKAGNANIIVSEAVTGLVTMVIVDRPWRDALEAVVKTNGYHLVQEDRGILRVVDDTGLSTHLERRLFQLKYIRPMETYVAKIDTLYAVGEQVAAEHDAMQDFPLLGALTKMLSKDGELDYFDDQNSILVRDTRPVLDEIQQFVERLDVEPVQVYIDVKFVSTTNTDTSDYAFGVDGGVNFRMTGAQRSSRFPFNLGPGSFADNIFPGRDFDNIEALKPVTENQTFGNSASPVLPGVLDFSATQLSIRLLKTDLSAEVVQRPSLITLNNKAATIFVGETVRYAQAEAASNQSGGLQLQVREADNSPVQTGFQMLVIPHVVPGTNRIIMTVVPEAESLTGQTDPDLPGFDRFSVGAGTTGEGSISLPRVGSQTVVTTMMLENGQTGIVGGLMQTEQRTETQKVPILGDIPLLGWLFKAENVRDDERGLIVFLTPWIVQAAESADESLDRALEDLKKDAITSWEEMAAGFGT